MEDGVRGSGTGIRVTPVSAAELAQGLLDKVLAGRVGGHATEPGAPSECVVLLNYQGWGGSLRPLCHAQKFLGMS